MRHRVLLVALAFSAICGGLYACSSPPVATTHETVKAPEVNKAFTYKVAPVAFVAVDPFMYSLDAPVVLEPAKTVFAVPAATDLKTAKNCSRPQGIGLAMRRCGKSRLDVIHLIVTATTGHRLLHIDPGLS